MPLEDLTDGEAWVAFGDDGEDLEPEHGGPARLLVPHLYCGTTSAPCPGAANLELEGAVGYVGYLGA